MIEYECEKCGQKDVSKLVNYTLKFAKPVVLCGRCALELIPINQTAVKEKRAMLEKHYPRVK